MSFSRRKFLTLAGTTAAGVTMVSPLEAFYARVANGQVANGIGYGSLSPQLPNNADELKGFMVGGFDLGTTPLLELPPGFNYTAISITGQSMTDGGTVPSNHDGMAAFSGSNNTTILVRNHEVGAGGSNPVVAPSKYDQLGGGTTTVVIGSNRRVKSQYASLAGTIRNCAGGPTPWGSWVSCEENFSTGPLPTSLRHGYNFEVPASDTIQVADPTPLVAMGRFNHEAVAVEPETGWVYQTEDRGDSCFYRFIPNEKGNLKSGGTLEALKLTDSRAVNVEPATGSANTTTGYRGLKGVPLSVTWVKIDNVNPDVDLLAGNVTSPLSVRAQARSKGAARFSRGEGAWYGNGLTYFVCSNGGDARVGQVFAYKSNPNDPSTGTLTLVVEATASDVLAAPDNICVAPFGDLFLCEDGSGTEYVVGVNQKGELYRFATNALNGSEFAGACFSPDGKTMFVNIQDPGITLAIWGPWTRNRA